MENIIHFTVPKIVTPIQTEAIKRARALHPTWEIKVWQDPINSDGYLLQKYWSKANSGAQLADLIRLDVIYRWGGVYVDGDIWLLKPLDALVEKYDVFFASAFGDNLEGALIGTRKAHPIIRALIDDLLLNEPDWTVRADRTTGPDIFARIARWNANVTILPRETFYAYGPHETHSRKNHRHSYGEHLWEVSWKEQIDERLRRRVHWKPAVRRWLKRFITTAFRIWHRFKALDRQAQRPRYYPMTGDIVVKTIHGFSVIVDGSETARTPKVIFGDEIEFRDENATKQILRGGDWVIDVGSKTGSFCMLAGQRIGEFGRVFAYQNDPKIANIIERSAVLNRMHDRVVVRRAAIENQPVFGKSVSSIACTELDREFDVDLPIKLLNIDVESDAAAVLKGARRLLEQRCIDFVRIELFKDAIVGPHWRRHLGGTQLDGLLPQLNFLREAGYDVCTISKGGLIVEHKSVTAALDSLEGRNIIFRARDQYTPTETSLDR